MWLEDVININYEVLPDKPDFLPRAMNQLSSIYV